MLIGLGFNMGVEDLVEEGGNVFAPGERFVFGVIACIGIGTRFEGYERLAGIIGFDGFDQVLTRLLTAVFTNQQARGYADNEQQSQEGEEEKATFQDLGFHLANQKMNTAM